MRRFFSTAELSRERAAAGRRYLEFVRIPALSAGVYTLPAGSEDTQKPHSEDEMYHVLRGRARFCVMTPEGEQDCEIGPGDTLLVLAHAEHRFHNITEDLEVFVFFAPAETS
jgi:mannose-6-phosphate isomerase-like protein (cupin superfamily)